MIRLHPKRLLLSLTVAAWALSGCTPEADPSAYPVIPFPSEIEPRDGVFVLDSETLVMLDATDDDALRNVVERWAAGLREATGLPLPVTGMGGGAGGVGGAAGVPNALQVRVEAADGTTAIPAGEGLPGIEAESYELEVRSDGVTLQASGLPGIFYGLQTLGQLVSDSLVIPAVDIDDAPRFRYRGMQLDVGRHYFPVAFIKRYLDYIAAYKMNVFHWHLTEDQGWRIEIQGYPRLTEVGSCRAETMVEKNFDPLVGDGVEYCGFYTRDEAREIVEYARERFITVIPEIEMPGHSSAALAAYPEFSCREGPFEVVIRWGVADNIYCPKEETFAFLEDVLTEVMAIFPSPIIHIGGDEAPKRAWEDSPLAQEVMRRENLADEDELQSWFIQRMEAFLSANGRSLMGWDEILEGGLAPNAIVMSWRGMEGGIQAAREGHDVVMTPTSHTYFDYYQGDPEQEPLAIGGLTTLERVYELEPVPPDLTEAEGAHVLGAQANVWTEYISTAEYAEYMIFPRMLALAEVVWSPAEKRDWGSFARRLPAHLTRLEADGVNYRPPES